MASRGTLVIRFIGDLREFNKATTTMEKRLGATGRKLTMGVTAPVVALGVSMLKTAGDFEAGMNKVASITGATGGDLSALRDQAKELGRTTKFSASEAADGMSFLGMAGFDTKEILAAMPGVLDLAAASGQDLATSADIASNILSGFGASASDAGKFADIMAKTTASANTDMVQLGDAMKYVAPVAASAGISVEETAAIIGKLSDAGIQGSMAGTTLRGAISRLLDPSTKAASALKRLGIDAKDGEGNLRPMSKIVDDLGKKGAKTADFMAIFGQRAGPGMAALVSAGGPAIRKLTGQLEASGGTAERMADIQMQGLNGALTSLKSAWEGLMISFADSGALDTVTEIVIKVTDKIREFGELSPRMRKMIIAFALLAAAVGPLLLITAKMITATRILTSLFITQSVVQGKATKTAGPLGKALLFTGKAAKVAGRAFLRMTLMMLSNPFVLVAAAAIALAIVIFKNWDKITKWTGKAWDWISNKVSSAWSWIKTKTVQIGGAIVAWVRSLPGKLVSFFLNWTLPGLIIKHWDQIKSGSVRVATSLVEWVKKLPGRIVDGLGNLGSLLYDKGTSLVTGLWNGISSMGSWLAGKLTSWVKDKIPGPIAKALGIASPSKLMRDLAVWIPRGLALGIDDGSRAVAKATDRMASLAVPRLGGTGMPQPAPAGGGGGMAVHAPIQITMPATSTPESAAAAAGGRIVSALTAMGVG